jgi:excisionase family DNA binding protein
MHIRASCSESFSAVIPTEDRAEVFPCMAIDSKLSFDPLLHPRDAGQYLGVHPKTVIKMARLHQLPALRLGKHWRFRAVDLTAWAAEQVESNRQPHE